MPAISDLPETWGDLQCPEWVPQNVWLMIVRDYKSRGSGPRDWAQSALRNCAPPTGATVGYYLMADGWADVIEPVDGRIGRYVHCWSNIGRIVTAEGKVLLSHCFVDLRHLPAD